MNALADIVHDEILSMMICMADYITGVVSSYQQFFLIIVILFIHVACTLYMTMVMYTPCTGRNN